MIHHHYQMYKEGKNYKIMINKILYNKTTLKNHKKKLKKINILMMIHYKINSIKKKLHKGHINHNFLKENL